MAVAKTSSGGDGIKWFVGITITVAAIVGGYALYSYFQIQKINKTVVTPTDAMTLINQALAQPS